MLPRQGSAYQPLVPGEDDGVEHGLVEEAVAHPLRDNNVHLLHGQLHLLHLALEDGNDCGGAQNSKATNYVTGHSVMLRDIERRLRSLMASLRLL